jgi:hypothetical protein
MDLADYYLIPKSEIDTPLEICKKTANWQVQIVLSKILNSAQEITAVDMPSVTHYTNKEGNIIPFKNYYSLTDMDKRNWQPYFKASDNNELAKSILEKTNGGKREAIYGTDATH